MPIRPENKKHYTAKSGWPLIRAAVMAEAGNGCEWDMGDGRKCGAPHRALIKWVGEGWVTCPASWGVQIVLTIAHLNQDPTDNRRSNLMALCQRHHNRLDAKWRAKGIRDRRHAKAGQMDAFDQARHDAGHGKDEIL